MTFALAESLEILERTPAVLESLLRAASPAWTMANEGAGTWSAREVVAHLIHAEETNWLPRARTILEQGEGRALDPFDRFAHLSRFREWTLEALLARFGESRRASLETVRGWRLTDEQLSLRGRHPELGAVTLRQLLATWAVHDLDHIAQIVRVMAKRYTEEVGPWGAYLSVLEL